MNLFIIIIIALRRHKTLEAGTNLHNRPSRNYPIAFNILSSNITNKINIHVYSLDLCFVIRFISYYEYTEHFCIHFKLKDQCFYRERKHTETAYRFIAGKTLNYTIVYTQNTTNQLKCKYYVCPQVLK